MVKINFAAGVRPWVREIKDEEIFSTVFGLIAGEQIFGMLNSKDAKKNDEFESIEEFKIYIKNINKKLNDAQVDEIVDLLIEHGVVRAK